MALNNTTTVHFLVNKYNATTPSYVISGASSHRGLMFCNTGATIPLSSTTYSYVTFDITFNGVAKYAAVSFGVLNNSTFSVGTSLFGIFTPFTNGVFDGYDFKLINGVKKRIYVIINGDPSKVENSIQVLCSVGISSGIAASPINNMVIEYNCNVPLFSYAMDGMHVYSPYDAINTPRLRTNLYSVTDINNWTSGTRIWMSPQLDTPAFPYYYGYGDYVYKIGGQFDRSYGTKEKYEVTQTKWRALWGKSPIVNRVVIGPASFLNVAPDTTDACVNVIMVKSGIITEKIDKSTLQKPSKYKYLMGYNTNKQASNDLFFTKYIFNESKFYPITGQLHAMYKLATGYINSITVGLDGSGAIDPNFKLDPNNGTIILLASGLSLGLTIAAALMPSLNLFLESVFIPGGSFGDWVISILAGSSATGPLIPALIIIAMIIGLIFSLTKKTRKIYEENCKQFLHEYTINPYILNNFPLSRKKDMSTPTDGNYCDGIYFYTESGGLITGKELSSTNALLHENPITLGFQYSLAVDEPTTVIGTDKFLVLPYLSGIPVEYNSINVWYNTQLFGSVPIICYGDLVYSDTNSNTITIPSGFTTSFISQADADAKALAFYNDAIAIINSNYNYCKTLEGDNLGVLDSYFTHELKVENTPTTATCYFNNTGGNGLQIGQKLYFDIQGRVLALTGYYAIDGDSAYRVFYKAIDGYVTDIITMASSSSTTATGTSGTLPLITTNLEFSSNWFFHSAGLFDVVAKITTVTTPIIFNPNTLYIDPMMVKGFVKPDHSFFYLYDDNYNALTYKEADSGWYVGLIEWFINEPFYYGKSQTIKLEIDEICLPSTMSNNAMFGFYVTARNNNILTPIYNFVNLTTKVYKLVNGNTLLAATYTLTTQPYQSSTYFEYDNQILPTDNINFIEISSINSPNPENRITYTIGGFNNCDGPTTTYVPTTTNYVPTTTANPCVQISEQLGWSSISGSDACTQTRDTYYGNSASFASTTKISINNLCSPTLGGYYSNGSIWKYTFDGNNFITQGICGSVTTTVYLPTTTSYVATTTSYATTVYVPTTTAYLPTTTSYVPTTTSYVATTFYVPTTTAYVPTTTAYVPTTTAYSPTTTYTLVIVPIIVDNPAISGTISYIGEQDWFIFITSTAGVYTMRTNGTTDVKMDLYASDMTTLIASDDDSGGSNQPFISQTLAASTVYYIKLYYWNNSNTGSYTIQVNKVVVTTAYVPTTTAYLPTTTVYLPTTTEYLPTTYLPTTTVYLPTTTVYLPTTTVYLPTTTAYLPTTTAYLPTTTAYLPTTTAYLPTTTEYLPTTTEYLPTTTEYLPTTTEYLPTTTEYLPTCMESIGNIGTEYGGGLVAYFYVNGDNGYVEGECHGLIVASTNTSESIYYGPDGITASVLDGGLGNGFNNTNAIINMFGSGTYAAKICRDYTGGGYNDWFLPNVSEMNKLAGNFTTLGMTIMGSTFDSANEYFTSVIGSGNTAKGLYCHSDQIIHTADTPRAWTLRVRAMRYF